MRYIATGLWGSMVVAVATFQMAAAQVLPVSMPVLEDALRRDQLLGRLDSTISFAIRPLDNQALSVSDIYRSGTSKNGVLMAWPSDSESLVQLMPIVWEQQYVTKYPYGWNDGGMIPAVGYQTAISAGVYARYKWFSVQLRPEFVYARNLSYPGYNGDNRYAWRIWYDFANNIDMPERFGTGSYTRVLPGQSSVRFNYGVGSIGISTENLWWGPGRRNALLMSNTAPGFPHLTLNTRSPIRTGIGSFEGQLIAGRLSESGFTPTPLGNPDHFDQYYKAKRDDWRYLSGLVFTYQPKWLPGLFVGMARSFVTYSEDLGGGLGGYLPMLGPGSQSSDDPEQMKNREERMNRDVYGSVFARWLMSQGNAEIYVEYGRNDPPWNTRDLRVELDHTRAFVVGFRKLIPLDKLKTELIQVGVEATQMDATRTADIRRSPSWYTHDIVRHGYTHRGQVLGAGVGPGSNVQSIDISWVRGLKRVGVQAERFVHHNDFYYKATSDFRRRWVDLGIGLESEWDIGPLLLHGRFNYIYAYNYQYELEIPEKDWEGFWHFLPQDKVNLQFRLGLMYRF